MARSKSFNPLNSNDRKEYSRLRSLANKRLERLGAKYPDSDTVRHTPKFASLRSSDEEVIKSEYNRLKTFIKDPRSTEKGLQHFRKATLKTWKEKNKLDWIPDVNTKAGKETFDQFGKFMDYLHDLGYETLYASERVYIPVPKDGAAGVKGQTRDLQQVFTEWRLNNGYITVDEAPDKWTYTEVNGKWQAN